MKSYMNKTELARCFGISSTTVYKRLAGIEEEIKKGRYNRYAIAEGLISAAVFADYAKYYKRLEDRNLRKTVPAFDINEARTYLLEMEGKTPVAAGNGSQRMVEEFVRLKQEEEQSWQEYMDQRRRNKPSDAAREAYEEIRNKYVGTAMAIANKAAESLVQSKGGKTHERLRGFTV